jgi:hypothetical protein
MAKRTNETAELVTLLERGGVETLRRRLGITRHLAERTAWLLRCAHLEGRELAPEDIPRRTISARRQSASAPGEAAAVVPTASRDP